MAIDSWRDRSACAGEPVDTFFALPRDREQRIAADARAKSFCALCPVRAECLEFALDNRVMFGVIGGTNAAERKELLRRRQEVSHG